MDFTKKNIKAICSIIVFAGIVFFIIMKYDMLGDWLQLLIGILMPFILGAAIGFVLNIPMSFFERTIFKKCVKQKKLKDGTVVTVKRGFVRPISVALTFIIVGLIVFGFISLVVPQILSTVGELAKTASSEWPKFKNWAMDLFKNNEMIEGWIDSLNIDMGQVVMTAFDFIKNGAGSAFTNVFSAAQAVVSGITTTVIGTVFALYIVTEKENHQRRINLLIDAAFTEKTARRIRHICEMCRRSFSTFITRQCLETCIIAAMFFVVLSIAQMPYALLISLIIAFSALIPVVGMFIGCIIGALLILMVSPVKAVIFVVIFIILQQIEGNLIYPRVVGSGVGLPPMLVLVAVILGSSLMGIAGLFVFIPLASVLYSLIREWTTRRLKKKQLAQAAPAEAISE